MPGHWLTEDFSDINALILDYLTMAGYPNAAARFSAEANLQPQHDDSSIGARQQIQNSIHRGDIQAAIDALNDLDPEVNRASLPGPPSCLSLFAVIINRVFTCTTLRVFGPDAEKQPPFYELYIASTYLTVPANPPTLY
jgi:hypothetical protein